MVQGRFLFFDSLLDAAVWEVLIPLVQGRFLFLQSGLGKAGKRRVLIPLVQGRFLFVGRNLRPAGRVSLNPFGSGTFFIQTVMDKKEIIAAS